MEVKNRKRWMFALTFIFGLLMAVQYRILDTGIKYIPIENIQEQITSVEQLRGEVALLKATLNSVKEDINLYTAIDEGNSDDLFKALTEKEKKLKEFLHYTDVAGEGIILIVDDGTRELGENENLNFLLVHDTDLSAIVEELQLAGAEAISINGERIVFYDTIIRCSGMTTNINGEHIARPFIVKAIGNRKDLEAVITHPAKSTSRMIEFDIFVELNTSISVNINKFEGVLIKQYMNLYKEGE